MPVRKCPHDPLCPGSCLAVVRKNRRRHYIRHRESIRSAYRERWKNDPEWRAYKLQQCRKYYQRRKAYRAARQKERYMADLEASRAKKLAAYYAETPAQKQRRRELALARYYKNRETCLQRMKTYYVRKTIAKRERDARGFDWSCAGGCGKKTKSVSGFCKICKVKQ